jgi:hypothetical protein
VVHAVFHKKEGVMQNVAYVGLDVHKATISVSVAEDGRDGAVRFIGTIPNTPSDVLKLVKRLAKNGQRLEFCCYEDGEGDICLMLAERDDEAEAA